MKHIKGLSVVLFITFFNLNEAQFVEMPTDMWYSCPVNGQYPLPVDDPSFSDLRIKRQEELNLADKIEDFRRSCCADLGIPIEEAPEDLLEVKKPSPKVKCLMACVLQRLNLMTSDNLISVQGIQQIADEIGNFNPLITSVAIALVEQFNARLVAAQVKDQCEAGFLINRYIAKELKNHKVEIK